MQFQGPDKENYSEEIYQRMIEEIFDLPEFEKAHTTKKFIGDEFSKIQILTFFWKI